jgi:hypothetical protein
MSQTVEKFLDHAAKWHGAVRSFPLARMARLCGAAAPKRAKDLVKSGWIIPAEIERIVCGAPSAVLAAVIARDNTKWGVRPILVVQLRKDATIEGDELLDSPRGRLAN